MYPGVGGALLLPLFCWQCVYAVCARKKEGGEIEGLVPIIDELGLYVGFL